MQTLGEIVPIVSASVAVLIFGFAVFQYAKAQRWKRIEFVAQLYKEFSNDPQCQRVMWMIDYPGRTIEFPNQTEGSAPIRVGHELVIAALHVRDGETPAEDHMRIRDAFDRFLSFVEQFEIGIQNGLIKKKDVQPYFEYWIDSFNKTVDAALREGIDHYETKVGFKNSRIFFKRWRAQN